MHKSETANLWQKIVEYELGIAKTIFTLAMISLQVYGVIVLASWMWNWIKK